MPGKNSGSGGGKGGRKIGRNKAKCEAYARQKRRYYNKVMRGKPLGSAPHAVRYTRRHGA